MKPISSRRLLKEIRKSLEIAKKCVIFDFSGRRFTTHGAAAS
jgi:hypothetical protein